MGFTRADTKHSEGPGGLVFAAGSAERSALLESTLVRVHAPLDFDDPWDLLETALARGEEVFAWRDGRTGLCALGLGVSESVAPRGAGRFLEAQRTCSRWCEECAEVVLGLEDTRVEGLPLAFGGFSFSGRVGRGEVRWEGWADGRLVIPETIVWQKGRDRGLVFTQRKRRGERVDNVCEMALERQEGLRRELRRAGDRQSDPAQAGLDSRHGDGEAWRGLVAMATEAISAGQMQKVVLARGVELTPPAGQVFDTTATLRKLRAEHPGAFVFCTGDKARGCFLGATPELLVRLEGRQVRTDVLAGTAPRGESPERDQDLGMSLLDSAKDRHEHALTVNAIEAALEPLCKPLNVGDTDLRKLKEVQHLSTPIEGVLNAPTNVLALVEALHPTPAVGGLPRERALDWIDGSEALERGWYAGPVGWVGTRGQGSFAVAIRSALVKPAGAYAFVGAGIVSASDPTLEWRETGLKLETISGALVTREDR